MTLQISNKENLSMLTSFLGNNAAKLSSVKGQNVKSIFDMYDKDKSGKLDSSEISTLLKDYKLDNEFQIDSIMEEVDENGDGAVDMNEIKAYAKEMGVELDENTKIDSLFSSIGSLFSGLGGILTNLITKIFKGKEGAEENTIGENIIDNTSSTENT